uniref:BTB domain-containing protein n=1 Tax=Bracon brevicornis TaxID=1563983 RepID=A0A6V7J1V5_9HYME
MTANVRCGRTRVKTEHFVYEWTIENFQFLDRENAEILDSPPFNIGPKNTVWNLKFYPCGTTKDTSDFVSIFLCLQKKGTPEPTGLIVKYQLSIVKSNETLIKQEAITKYKKEGIWGWSKFMERAKLLRECEHGESFIIRCSMELAMVIATEPENITISLDFEKNQLGQDCHQLIQEVDQFSDITITVDTKKYHVHKVMLAARSTVFKAMLTHNEFEENRTRIINIVDYEPEVIAGMIEFIYTDKVTNLEVLADRLIGAAHKYELKRLRTMCEGALGQCLDTKNAANILVLAHMYEATKLLEYTINFIADNFYEVAASENYDKISDLELLKKVLRAVAERRG